MALKTLHSIKVKDFPKPSDWPGSQHQPEAILFPNHIVKEASREAMKGLHVRTSTLDQPVQPTTWKYVDKPRVSILVPKVEIGTNNEFQIPVGEYFMINRSNRAPMRDKWALGETYEFPGRAYRFGINDVIEKPDERNAFLLLQELGISEEECKRIAATKLAENVSACAGDNSLIYTMSKAQIPETAINRMIQQWGADHDESNGVVKIHRPCDGGIIDGIELVPVTKMRSYLKALEEKKCAIASTTYAALHLAI